MDTKYLMANIRAIVDETLKGENRVIYRKHVTRTKMSAYEAIPSEKVRVVS